MNDADGNYYAVKYFFQNQRRASEHYEALTQKNYRYQPNILLLLFYYANELIFDDKIHNTLSVSVVITRRVDGCTLQEKIMRLSDNNEKKRCIICFKFFYSLLNIYLTVKFLTAIFQPPIF
jgi:hypothetical protein